MFLFILDKYSLASEIKLLTSSEKVESISTLPKKFFKNTKICLEKAFCELNKE